MPRLAPILLLLLSVSFVLAPFSTLHAHLGGGDRDDHDLALVHGLHVHEAHDHGHNGGDAQPGICDRTRRARRIPVADTGTTFLTTEAAIQRLDIAAERARRFVAVLAAQQTLLDAGAATQLVEETVKASCQRHEIVPNV